MTTQTASPVQARLDELVDGEGRPALVGYLPVGYPSVPGSADAVRAMVDAGVDVVELGMPYTDPVMDGPVIQRAVEAALQRGTRVRDTLHVVEQVAGRGAPILVMTYWNLVLRYGVEAYARDLAAAGGAGLITPDLIPDEAGDWLEASDRHALDRAPRRYVLAPGTQLEDAWPAAHDLWVLGPNGFHRHFAGGDGIIDVQHRVGVGRRTDHHRVATAFDHPRDPRGHRRRACPSRCAR